MAPSPTGSMHIGTARVAVFNWLFAKKMGGAFVLRIEDTDIVRSKKEYEQELLEGLRWLGIIWDEGPDWKPVADKLVLGKISNDKSVYGPYRQSERTTIYRKYLERLMADGHAYYCYCTKEELEAQKQDQASRGLPPKYDGHCRNLSAPPADRKPEVIRFRVPEMKVSFRDMVRGTVEFDATLFGDIVIAKDLDSPLYNFAVVVDDELMKISHVIRGEEHLGNTPKQILMCRALGFEEPTFAHLPLILNPDRSKMSKRFGDSALLPYREKGYLPEAIVNFIALLGWHPTDDQEILTMDELVAKFDITRVQKAGAVFDHAKLDWINREYIKKMSVEELTHLAIPFLKSAGLEAPNEFIERVIKAEQARVTTLKDFAEQGRFYFVLAEYEPDLLVWKKMERTEVKPALERVLEAFSKPSLVDFTREKLSATLESLVVNGEKGKVFWPLRVALSGLAASPDPIEIMTVIGKEETMKRIEIAMKKM